MVATALKMPISGTHSIVGATIGFSVVLRGWESIKWAAMTRIVLSWFASPILSGFISTVIYLVISKTILNRIDPFESGLKMLPLFYGVTVAINISSLVIGGPAVFGLNLIPWYYGILIAKIIGVIASVCVAILLVPRLRRKVTEELKLKLSKSEKSKPGGVKLKAILPLSEPDSQTTGAKRGFDNKAFKPDIQPIEPVIKPVEVQPDKATLEAKSAEPKPTKPTIAPKPAFLTQPSPPLEWIDLGPFKSEPSSPSSPNENGDSHQPIMFQGERLDIFRLFSSLQILTACFASFAHGTNDVSNAVAPLAPIWNIYSTGREDVEESTQIWILAFGGIGICTGLWAWGRAVMSTVGTGLTQLTPSKGFAIELGAAISVLCASKLGLPISTTHCKVGSVVIVGLVSSKFCENQEKSCDVETATNQAVAEKPDGPVDWKLFGNIALTWVVTVPLAAIASALVMIILRWVAL